MKPARLMLFQKIRLSLLEHHVWSFTNTNCLEFCVTRGKQALILSHLPSILKHMLYNHANKKKQLSFLLFCMNFLMKI